MKEKARAAKQKAQKAKSQLSQAPTRTAAVSSGLQGAGPSLSRPEFENIMRSKGITANQLLERAGRRGLALNAGVVNAANKGKLGGESVFSYNIGSTIKGPGEYAEGMKGLSLSRGQQYSGTYEAGGQRTPIVQTKQLTRLDRNVTSGQGGASTAPSAVKTATQTEYGVRPMSEEEKKTLTAGGSTPRWIPNLNAPGTENYDPQYGGGGWVSTKGVPGGSGPSGSATDEFMKAYSKATTMAKQLGQMGTGGDVSGVYNLAKMFDERQAQQPAAGLTGYSQPTQAGTAGESTALSGGKVQKLKARLQKTKTLIKSSKSELAARGF